MNEEEDDRVADLSDPEGPDELERDDPDAPPLMPCPYCGKMIHEEAEWCHLCGKYLSEEDKSPGAPKWILIGALLGMLGLFGCTIAWLLS